MTNFVHCRGCGEKIHESAPTCPKCGAPQGLATAVSPRPGAAEPSGGSPMSGYSAVPWFRRRWFIILCVIIFAPIAGLLALTGPLYYSHKSETRVFPKSVKIILCITSAAALFQAFVPAGTGSGLYVAALCVVALVLGFKNQWPEK